MRAEDQRGLLSLMEAAKRGIDTEVDRAASSLNEQPVPLGVLWRAGSEPEHPPSTGEPSSQPVDRERRGRGREALVVARATYVSERTEQRFARAGRTRLERKVLRVSESRLERRHPRSGGEPAGTGAVRACAVKRRVAHLDAVRLIQPERLQLRQRARFDRPASALADHGPRKRFTPCIQKVSPRVEEVGDRRPRVSRERGSVPPDEHRAGPQCVDQFSGACRRARPRHRPQRKRVYLRKPGLVEGDDLPRF